MIYLETFFISWRNQKPQKPFSLIVLIYDGDVWDDILDDHEKNVKIKELGVVGNFGFETFNDRNDDSCT